MTSPAPHPALSLLLHSHPPALATQIHINHIQHRPLLLRPSSPEPSGPGTTTTIRTTRRLTRQHRARTAARAAKAQRNAGRGSLAVRTRVLSAKTKRRLGVYDIPRDQWRWALYRGLHGLWCGYVRDVLGLAGYSDGDGNGEIEAGREKGKGKRRLMPEFVGPMVASADFHGAVVRVVRSGCVGRVGVRGVVVKDTKFTFEVVTREDRLKVLPKERTVFRVEVPVEGDAWEEIEEIEGEVKGKGRYVFEIHGAQFMTSAPDRANKKFKMHVDPEL